MGYNFTLPPPSTSKQTPKNPPRLGLRQGDVRQVPVSTHFVSSKLMPMPNDGLSIMICYHYDDLSCFWGNTVAHEHSIDAFKHYFGYNRFISATLLV